MKRTLFTLILFIGTLSLFAYNGNYQHISKEEFQAKQQAFLTEKAGLTEQESQQFFPVYFELDKKKRELNDQVWKLLRKGDSEQLTDAQYEEMLLKVYDLRIESDQLDKKYYDRFKKILSPQKIYKVQRAEAKFHREMLKNMPQRKGNGNPPPKK